jgi:hypothetical protein
MRQHNLLLACLTSAIAASTVAFAMPNDPDQVQSVRGDLDRDGRAETFTITDNGQSETSLIIQRPGKPTIIARNMVWSLEPASIGRAANGSIVINSSHMGIGRSAHEQTLTIAYRNGAYQVVGITRSAWDKLDPDAGTSCDINLLTGRGMVRNRPVRRQPNAMPATAWKAETPLPAGCETR